MNRKPPARLPAPRRQRGAALVVGLILLLVLTILAVSGVFTATSELRMAGNQQQQELAFQAAETGLERAFIAADLNTSVVQNACGTVAANPDCPPEEVDAADPNMGRFSWEIRPDGDDDAPGTAVGMSIGSFQAYYFVAESTGEGPGDARSVHEQGFYVVGPGE